VFGEAYRSRQTFSEFRLPPGRHGIPPEEVAENQRWRLLGAAAEVLAESGHVRTNSTRVSKVAGVSPATFYQHFANVGECLLAAYEAASDWVWGIVSDACREEEIGWPERLAVGVASALRLLAVEPGMAHLLGDEAAAGEPAIARSRQAGIERLAELLAAGRALRPANAAKLPAGTERHLVAGAFAIFSERVAAGDADRLPELAPELIEMLSAPYVGS
jgi:AcrR family transcriptional regulator